MFIDACEDGYEQFLSAHLIHTDAWQIDPSSGALYFRGKNPYSTCSKFFGQLLDVLEYKFPEHADIIRCRRNGEFTFNVRVPTGTLEYQFKLCGAECTDIPTIWRVKRVDKETVL